MTARMYGLALLAAFGMMRACIIPAPVGAQDDEAIVVARVVAHEAGIDGAADVAGVYAVLRRGADRRGISLAAMARMYSPRLHARQTSRSWAMELDASCTRPRGYPLPWTDARRASCLALVEAARAAVSAPPTCSADDWGSARDHERARLAGRRFRFVDCGAARNLFSERVQ